MDETEGVAYLDNEDAAEQQELYEEQQESVADIPYRRRGDSLYHLFRNVWKAPDSSKIGNLNMVELGKVNVSVRDCQFIALLATVTKHEKFAGFFKGYSEVISSTSMSKKGWFVELFVSQKKYTTRSSAVAAQTPEKKKWIFERKDTPESSQAAEGQ